MPTFGSGIRSVQRGLWTLSKTTEVTDITEVEADKAFVVVTHRCLLITGVGTARVTLNSTYLKAVKASSAGNSTLYVDWQVIEYN